TPLSTVTNRVTITSTVALDALPTNNSHDDPTARDPGSADLELVKTAPATVQPNHELTYTLAVTNHGPSDAIGLSLTDSIPSNTTFKRTKRPASWTCLSGSEVACTDSAHLAPGATDTLQIVVTVGALADGTTISNNAAVGA